MNPGEPEAIVRDTVTVRFEDTESTVQAQRGSTVAQAAREAGCPIDVPCGGRGVCGGCGVLVTQGALAPPDEAEFAGLRRAPNGVRLACRARVDGPVTLRTVHSRSVRGLPQTEVRRPAPSASDIGGPTVAAVDLGTSTLAAVVVDAQSRAEIGRGAVLNRQSVWGADVLSRISAAASGEADSLREAAESSVIDALSAACSDEGACLQGIRRLVIAGNSAMSGLLLGLDVTSLEAYPFEAPYSGPHTLPPSSAIVRALGQGAETLVLPPLAGFIGGDVLAGLIAEGLASGETGSTWTLARMPRSSTQASEDSWRRRRPPDQRSRPVVSPAVDRPRRERSSACCSMRSGASYWM